MADSLELVELPVDECDNIFTLHRVTDDFGHVDVALAQLAQVVVGALDVAGAGVSSDSEQTIGHLRHRRDHHDRPACVATFLLCIRLALGADNCDEPFDCGLVGDGRATEFHDHHQSNTPSAAISSAFKMAAPAAPRTVL
jgi:hypothetical protein